MKMNKLFRLIAILVLLFATACGGCQDEPTPDGGTGSEDTGESVSDMGSDQGEGEDSGRADISVDRDFGNGDDVFVFDFGNRDAAEEDTGPAVLRLDAVIPPRGPISGGTQVTLIGEGFSEESVVYFGGRQADVEFVDDKLVGQAPAGPGPGPVTVKIIEPSLGEDVLVGGYEYTVGLEITSVTPNRIPTSGGVELTVMGSGFDQFTRISLGGETGLRHELVDETLLRVIAPAHPAGLVDARATSRDASVVLPAAVTYFDELRVDHVRPAAGDIAGGDTVVVSGAGFVDGMSVEFDGQPASVVSIDTAAQTATVVTPAHAAGIVDVRVETPAGDAALTPDAFTYATAGSFAASSIAPPVGPAIGGAETTIMGAGLDAAGLTVRFDGQSATIVDQGYGHVTVQTPAHTPATVDVVVAAGASSATLNQAYTYVDDLWIDRITPDTGGVAGGENVVLEGEGFTGASRVAFGGINAAFTVDSPTQITAVTPAHSAGVVDVTVERGGITARFADGYTFTEALEVYGFSPTRGSIAGGTYVEVRGRGFVGNLDVVFDQTPGADVRIIDAQTLSVRTPPHEPAIVGVTVSNGTDTSAAPEPYTYFNPGSRFGGAWGGPIQGAVNVTVFSTGGTPIEGGFVMLSTNSATPYQGQTDVNGMVTLSGPDVFGEQTITATAAGYSSTTVQRVNAENVTIFLSPPPEMGSPPPGPSPAKFTGFLSGLDKLAEPGPTEFQMAIVYITQRDPWTDNPDPGPGNIVLTNGTYTINSRLGDVALIAVGGLYDNATQKFRPIMMAVERYLFASEGETYVVDLDLNIPLDTPLTFKLNNVPSYVGGPDMNQVIPYLDLGFEGVWGGLDFAEGTTDVIVAEHQAALTGVLSDASYLAIGGAQASVGSPATTGIKRGITNTAATIEMPGLVGIAHITSPEPGYAAVNNLYEFDLREPVDPDFYWVIVMDFMQVTKWEVFLPGTARSFRLPDFPDFSHLPAADRPVPYPGGLYIMLVIGIQKPNFDFDNVSYNDLSLEEWDAYSIHQTLFQFQ